MEMEYAIVENGAVVNVIVAAADVAAAHFPGAPRIDQLTPRPGIGWSFAAGIFTAPPTPPAPPRVPPVLTPWGFRKLLTLTERMAIDSYPEDASKDPQLRAMVRTIQGDFAAAQEIDTADPDTRQAVGFLAAPAPNGPGLLTPARAAAILAGQAPA